jgi:hypothetical protein
VTAPRIPAGYRFFFCTILVIASGQALPAQGQPHAHAGLLGAVEALGTLLLMWRGTQWLGAWTLLVVFSCAQIAAARASD